MPHNLLTYVKHFQNFPDYSGHSWPFGCSWSFFLLDSPWTPFWLCGSALNSKKYFINIFEGDMTLADGLSLSKPNKQKGLIPIKIKTTINLFGKWTVSEQNFIDSLKIWEGTALMTNSRMVGVNLQGYPFNEMSVGRTESQCLYAKRGVLSNLWREQEKPMSSFSFIPDFQCYHVLLSSDTVWLQFSKRIVCSLHLMIPCWWHRGKYHCHYMWLSCSPDREELFANFILLLK